MVEAVRRQLRQGQLATGDRLPTEAELAKSFGISIRSVREGVDQLVNEGLVGRRQGSGTYVREAATAAPLTEEVPRGGDTVAILLPLAVRGYHPFFSEVWRGVRERLASRGYSAWNFDFEREGLSWGDVHSVPMDERAVVDKLLAHSSLAGVVTGGDPATHLRPLLPAALPMVAMNVNRACPYVCYDWDAEYGRAVRHLRRNGCRYIWCCLERGGDAVALEGVEIGAVNNYRTVTELTTAACEMAMERLGRGGCDGVVAGSDFIAQGVLDAATRLGLRREETPRFVCFVNRESRLSTALPITTFVADGRRNGWALAELLHAQLHYPQRHPGSVTLACDIEDFVGRGERP